jgi:hypothetical protein
MGAHSFANCSHMKPTAETPISNRRKLSSIAYHKSASSVTNQYEVMMTDRASGIASHLTERIMKCSFRRMLYYAACASCALTIAGYAILPSSAATANGLKSRGGQICPTGCHDLESHCTGSASCQGQTATACFTGEHDRNGMSCGKDTGLCSNQGCGGVDSSCGG